MELWNDYEGKTVDGRYRLDRLIGPKGRSALFVTTDDAGEPALIRLIESLNDEAEILRRWRAVQAVEHENLGRVLACDQTVLDGVHLVYAVLESYDAELAEILKERTLTPDEAKQVASSVAAGLEALHAHGLAHEHVEPAHVVARGETVKLRSDLVREVGDGAEGAAMRKRDAHDLAVLIQETMTRRREPGGIPLPAPLDEMVRNGRSGAWGVSEMLAVVRPAPGPWAAATAAGAAKSGTAANGAGTGPGNGSGNGVSSAVRGGSGVGAGSGSGPVSGSVSGASSGAAVAAGAAGAVAVADGAPGALRQATPGRAVFSEAASRSRADADAATETSSARVAPVHDRIALEPEEALPRRKGLWAIAALGVLGAILLFWHFLHAGRPVAGEGPVRTPVSAAPTAVPSAAAVAPTPVPDAVPAGGASVRATKPSAARTGRERQVLQNGSVSAAARQPTAVGAETAAAGAVGTAASPHDARSEWRVVAFTYNREDQAQHKVAAIAQQHPDLRPEVFAPKGGSPYLVVLGGWMSSGEAAALREKARGEGLPRDTYAQNYKGR